MLSSDCVNVSDAIWDFVRDGIELPEEVLRHTRSCKSCAGTLAEARAGVAALSCVKPYPAAPDCRQSVMSRVSRTRRVTVFRRFAWAVLPVAVVVALLMVFYHGNPDRIGRRSAMVKQSTLPRVQKHADRVVVSAGSVRKPRLVPRPVQTQVALAPPTLESVPVKAESSTGRWGEHIAEEKPTTGVEFHSGSPGCSPLAGLERLGGKPATESVNGLNEQRIAFRQMLQTKIDQIAALIVGVSEGKSGLRMKSGASANPSGNTFRLGEWGDLPLASVYPALRPVETTLPGFGAGKILGAAALLEYEGSDVYLIFAPAPPKPKPGNVEDKAQANLIVLLSLGVNDSGTATYKEHARAALIEHTAPKCESFPHASISYEGAAAIMEMDWAEETYLFTLKR